MFRAGAHMVTRWDMKGLRRLAARFSLDRRGVAAVEFAFVAPLLLGLYFLTLEFSQGIETSKKVSRVSSMVADLVAQQSAITVLDLKSILKIAETTLQPYGRSTPEIFVTAVTVSNDSVPKATVAWSYKMSSNGQYGTGYTKTSAYALPTALKTKGAFLIAVSTTLQYEPMITWSADGKKVLGLSAALDGPTMAETYYLRPRVTNEILCSDCK